MTTLSKKEYLQGKIKELTELSMEVNQKPQTPAGSIAYLMKVYDLLDEIYEEGKRNSLSIFQHKES